MSGLRYRGRHALVAASVLAIAIMAPSSIAAASTGTPTPSPSPSPSATVDPVRAAEYWLDEYGITEAWKTTRGEGVTIAIIDTGIADGPVEFAGAVVGGTDVSGVGSPDGRTPVGVQDQAHGSYVGSVAASRGLPGGRGMIGVAPEADLLSVSLGFGASAVVPFDEQVATAMRWAVDNGADVINLSFTTNTLDWDPSWDSAFQYAYDHDAVVVVAAGNRGSGTSMVGAPATIPGVLTVGGVDRFGIASRDASTQGITIGVSAPSEELLGVAPDGTVAEWDGTSGASPIVAGIAALVRAAHPDLDAANVIQRIIATATPAEDGGPRPDPTYGFGLVDAEAAVTANVPQVASNPMGSLQQWVQIHRRANAGPTPTPSGGAVEIPPIPPAESPMPVAAPWGLTVEGLREVTLPLVALTAAGILVVLGTLSVVRRVRRARATR